MRLQINNNGRFGFGGVVNPWTQYHLEGGAFLINGEGAAVDDLTPNTRFVWWPTDKALQFGKFTGTEWDPGNVGEYSLAQGYNTIAKGDFSLCFGDSCQTKGDYSFSAGQDNYAGGPYSFAFGRESVVPDTSSYALAFGRDAEASGDDSFAFGWTAEASGDCSIAMGWRCYATDWGSVALGDSCIASNHDCFSAGEFNVSSGRTSTTLGLSNTAAGRFSVAIGDNNESNDTSSFAYGAHLEVEKGYSGSVGHLNTVDSRGSYAFGQNLNVDAIDAMAIGHGDSTLRITNDVDYSLMIGFNTDTATVFVSGGDGTSGSFGDVGIANTLPKARLHVTKDATDLVGNQDCAIIEMQGGEGSGAISTGLTIDLETDTAASGTYINYGINVKNTGGARAKGIQISSTSTNETLYNSGIRVDVDGDAAGINYGTELFADSGLTVHGLYSKASSGLITNVGVHGVGSGGSGANMGVYGVANGGSSNWGGYFIGPGYLSTSSWTYGSDAQIKSNIEDLEGSTDVLLLLRPRTYFYNTNDFPALNLPSDGPTMGLIAQELEEVLPGLVSETPYLEFQDTSGALQQDPQMLKGIKYTELIPLLIGGFQEQHQTITEQSDSLASLANKLDALESRFDELFDAVESCCSVQGTGDLLSGELQDDISVVPDNALDQNIPNPFNNITTIGYTLSCDCQATIRIYNSAGQLIETLANSVQSAGSHTIQWNSGSVEAGVYFYSLEVNGQELVRRAIKL